MAEVVLQQNGLGAALLMSQGLWLWFLIVL
jgi:hypothetical protein